MKLFYIRLAAVVSTFNAISDFTKLPDCLTTLMLISNSHTSDPQTVFVLATAASTSHIEDVETATNEQFI